MAYGNFTPPERYTIYGQGNDGVLKLNFSNDRAESLRLMDDALTEMIESQNCEYSSVWVGDYHGEPLAG